MCAMDVTELKPLEQKPLEQKLLNENPFEQSPLVQNPFEQNLSVEMAPSQQIVSNIMKNQNDVNAVDYEAEEKFREASYRVKLEHSHNYFNNVVANKQVEEIRFGMKSQALNLHAEQLVKPALPQTEKVEQNDSKKNLSDRERRKLESRQKSDLKKARKKGFDSATGNTLAYKKSMENAEKQVTKNSDAIKDQAALAAETDALKFVCPSNLFEERYQNKNSPPHNMPDIMIQLETIRQTLEIHEGKKDDYTPEKKAEFIALKKIHGKMNEVVEGILAANGLDRELESEDLMDNAVGLNKSMAKLIAEYTSLTRNTELTKAKFACELLDEPSNKEYLDKAKTNAKDEFDKRKGELPPEEKSEFDKLPIDFSSFDDASDYVKTMKKLDQHPEEYKNNKSIIDDVMLRYTADCKFVSTIKNKIAQIDAMKEDEKFLADTAETAKRVLTEHNKEYIMHNQNIERSNTVLDILLGTKGVGIEYHMYIQREYKIITEELKEYNTERDTAKQKYIKEKETQDDPKAREYQDFLNEKPLPGKEAEYISRHLIDHKTKQNNIHRDFMHGSHEEHLASANLSSRTVTMLLKGYNVDEMNQPVTLQDQKNKDEAKEILDTMTSGDHTKMAPIIDEYVKEILAFKIDFESLSEEQFPLKATELLDMSTKMTNFENILKENPWYALQTDSTILHMVNEITSEISPAYAQYLSMRMMDLDIDKDTGEFKNSKEKYIEKEKYKENMDSSLTTAKQAMDTYETRYRYLPYDVLLMKEVPEDKKAELWAAKLQSESVSRNVIKDNFKDLYDEIPKGKKGVAVADPRLVAHFSPKYEINYKGNPLVPAEKEKAREYTAAFASHEQEKMFPYVDKMVNEVMSIKLDPAHEKDEYFYAHIQEIGRNLESFLYIDNLSRDFPWYFEMKKGEDTKTEDKLKELGIEKDPKMKEKLENFNNETLPYTELMSAKLNDIGVSLANYAVADIEVQSMLKQVYTEEYLEERRQGIRENNRKNADGSQKIVEDNPKNADGSQKITENNQEKQ